MAVRRACLPLAVRRLASTSSSASSSISEELRKRIQAAAQEETAWAQRPGATQALQPPPFPSAAAVGAADLTTLEGYLASRGWNSLLSREGDAPTAAGLRVASHLLTYPLTLAAALNALRAQQQLERQAVLSSRGLVVACIGARAEAALPPHLWLEAAWGFSAAAGAGELSSISFIGPEVALPRTVTAVPGCSAAGAHAGRSSSTSSGSLLASHTVQANSGLGVQLRWARGLFHQVMHTIPWDTPTAAEIASDGSCNPGPFQEPFRERALPDAFVLFSPGMGHPHLSAGWAPTVDALLATGQPIVVTAHSQRDAVRDTAWLRARYGSDGSAQQQAGGSSGCGEVLSSCRAVRWLAEPAANALASRRLLVDDAERGGLVVAANAWWYAVQGVLSSSGDAATACAAE